jgi:hypothetical protein
MYQMQQVTRYVDPMQIASRAYAAGHQKELHAAVSRYIGEIQVVSRQHMQ